jgi:hypothetical protein
MGNKTKKLLEDPRTIFLREIVPVPEGVDKYNTLIVLGENNPHFGQFYHQMPVRQYNPFLLYFVRITCNGRDLHTLRFTMGRSCLPRKEQRFATPFTLTWGSPSRNR